MNTFERKKIADGVHFSTVYDDRFKTVRIIINAYVPMKKETAAENALLSQVLTRSCNRYRTLTELSRRLGYLYGAALYGGVSKLGDVQNITLSAVGIDDRYTADGKPVSAEISSLLCDVLFDPYVIDGAFVSSEIEQERRQLIESIDAEFNDKQVYAQERCINLMCEGEPYGLPHSGTKEEIAAVTAQSLYKAWKTLLNDARFEIMYVGCADSKNAEEVFRKAFESRASSPAELAQTVVRRAAEPKTFEEDMKLSQSKLVMGFRTGISETTADTTAMRLANTVLGGTAHSKLFNNVREKLSLCYYCSSQFNRSKGTVIIQSGVEAENIEKTRDAILHEIEEMKNGNISDFEVNSAKLAVADGFRSNKDTVEGLGSWYTLQLFHNNGEIRTVEEEIERFEKVTKQQVVDAIKNITLDTVFVLRGSGEEE